jgi:cytochrome c-type biogenesis protein CcmH/NrfF
MRRARLALLLALALCGLAAPPAQPGPRTTLPDVEDEVMCPVCGTPLNQAQAPQADRQRAFIRRLIAEGATKEEIKRRMAEQYGPEVLALPRSRGFDAAAHWVPIALGAVALLLLAFAAARWRGRRRVEPSATAPLSPADARRLDEDLARYDG